VLALAPRWRLILEDGWNCTSLEVPAGRWRNIVTGDEVEGGRAKLQELLQRFPVALLVRDSE
jgi:(1->4)-alpha-D-glucan 1-alpha-D-glucosylmutase